MEAGYDNQISRGRNIEGTLLGSPLGIGFAYMYRHQLLRD